MALLMAVLVVIVVVVVGVGWLRELRMKRRVAAMQALAERLGLSFEVEGAPNELVSMGDLLLFQQGQPSSTLENVMRGTRDDVDIAIYDYVFNIPVKRYFEVWRQTVVHIRAEKPVLPLFSLCPQAVLDDVVINIPSKEKREALLVAAGVRFPAHPDFTERYQLTATYRDKVAALFDDEVLGFLDDVGEVCVEGSGRYLFYYRMHKLLAPEEIEPLLTQALALFRLLREKEEAGDGVAG